MYQSDIIHSDKIKIDANWSEYDRLMDGSVRDFISHQEIGLYHPNTYVFYGKTVDSDATLKWNKITLSGMFSSSGIDNLPQNHYRVIQGNIVTEYKLKSSNSPGDGTVPVESLSSIRYAAKSVLATNVDHQSAYGVDGIFTANLLSPAVKFTLRSIIKIVHKEVSRETAN